MLLTAYLWHTHSRDNATVDTRTPLQENTKPLASKFHEYAKLEYSKMSGKDPYQARDGEGIMRAITLSHNSSHTSDTRKSYCRKHSGW